MPGCRNLEESQACRSCEAASTGPWGAPGLKGHLAHEEEGVQVQPAPLFGGSRILLRRARK